MKQRWVLAGLALVSLATVGGLAALKPDFESAQAGAARSSTTSTPESTAPASIADGAHDAGYSTPRTGVARTPAAPRLKSPGEIPDAETGAVPLDNEVSLPANLRQSLTQVADVYREQNRYPTFSQPIGSELDAVAKSPTGLRYNNFPVLMGDSTDHFEVIGSATSGDYAPVINNFTVGGLGVDFAIDQYWSWWHWDTLRLVRNGSDKSLSANVFDTLNQ